MNQSIEPTESYVGANRLRHRVLTWDAAGGGDPIVLAHGFLDHAWSFHLVAQRLAAAGRRVIAFDWRGHGATEWIGHGGYYHFPDYILDLAELLPQIAGERYDLVGHSMGGTACAMFAGTRPPALRSLALLEGLGPPEMTADALPDRAVAFLQSVARARAQVSRPMRDLDDAVRRMRSQHSDLDEELARFVAEKGTRQLAEGAREWCFDPLHRTTSPMPFILDGFLAMLRRIDVPTLVVSGARGYRNADHAARVGAIPDMREIELADVGHMLHWHAPDALATALLDHAARAGAR